MQCLGNLGQMAEIYMICRLIQEQYIGLLYYQASKGHQALLPFGESADFGVYHFGCYQKPRSYRAHLFFGQSLVCSIERFIDGVVKIECRKILSIQQMRPRALLLIATMRILMWWVVGFDD
jgi:hypothetical protein